MTGARVIVVGGHSRGVGKTTLIEQLLRANGSRDAIAIKVSAHRHAPAGARVPLVEEAFEPSAVTQTGRYLAAGARRAFLVRAPDLALQDVATFINRLQGERRTVIVESNRIVRWLVPDRLFFVVNPTIRDWKPSSAICFAVPDAVVCWNNGGSGRPRAAFGDHLSKYQPSAIQ